MNDELIAFLGATLPTNLLATYLAPGVGIVCTCFVHETKNRKQKHKWEKKAAK